MFCSSETANGNYMPPPIGNGDLSIMLDMEGMQRQKAWHCGMTPMIWRAGRRYDSAARELIPFGHLGQETGRLKSWKQELDVESASIRTDCIYEDGNEVKTEAFVHLELPILAIRKSFKKPFIFKYSLAQPGMDCLPPKRMDFMGAKTQRGFDINFKIAGQEPYHGCASVFCDKDAGLSVNKNEFKLEVEGGQACFFMLFVDSMDSQDVQREAASLKELIERDGFDGLFETHREAWGSYWKESYALLPSAKQSEVYATAQYHLRISSTRWSIPVGIFASHWNAKHFGFDEHFAFMGLATSGHLEVSRKVPEFRHAVLQKAIFRAFGYFGEDNSGTGARFHWETDENGDECAPSGFWLEHIFHMANIALSSWNQYLYSGDIEFLKEKGYPVIARCADFYRRHAVCEMGDGRLIIGKCTDLERLGAGRENAFMTSCGAIATFEAAAKAARLLGADEAKAADWSGIAMRLKASLPSENGRYIPYPGCKRKSIAAFAGSFPYPALDKSDAKQSAAIEDFLANEKECGNMYPIGNSVCAWYAGWKGVAFARLGLLEKARECVEQAAQEANCFSELFEMSSPVNHPWFTTAEGSYAHMVNESLIQSTEREFRIQPQSPGSNCAFKLAAMGGLMIEAKFEDGALCGLLAHAKRNYEGRAILPDGRGIEFKLESGESKRLI